MKLLKKLEAIKKEGNYAVTLYYGDSIGEDDFDKAPEDRKVTMVCHPIGFLGSVRLVYEGTVKSFLKFNPKSQPKRVSNPPTSMEIANKPIFYAFGTDDMLDKYYERFK